MSSETVDVVRAGKRLGVCRSTAYRLARQGRLGVPVIRVGRKLRVISRDLDRLLGAESEAQEVSAQ